MLKNRLSGVIFDLDNTLVSSSLNFDEIRDSIGCPESIDLLNFVNSLLLDEQHQATQKIIEYEMEDAHSAKKLIGTDQLLSLLSSENIPTAIITRNSKEAAMIKIKNNNINIPLLLTREDHKAKPAPDALLYVAAQWQLSPKNILYVGDYLYDIQAANNANTMSCLITYGENLSFASLADIVVNDLTELHQMIAKI